MSNAHHRDEIAQLLRLFANDVEQWKRTPQLLQLEPISESSVLSIEPNGLGTRFQSSMAPTLKRLRSKCLIAGFEVAFQAIQNSVQAAVHYWDAVWDFESMTRGRSGTFEINAEDSSLHYSLGRQTPDSDLLDLLRDIADEISGDDETEDFVGDVESEQGESASHGKESRQFADARADIPIHYRNSETKQPIGPLIGNGASLARAISGRDTARRKYLLDRHENSLFVREITTKELEVYFRDQRTFIESKVRFDKAMQQETTTTTTNDMQ